MGAPGRPLSAPRPARGQRSCTLAPLPDPFTPTHADAMAEPAREDRPWWLRGEERCDFCLERYAYEMEVRCVGCDRPVCPVCAVRVQVRRETFCPECAPGAAAPSGGEG